MNLFKHTHKITKFIQQMGGLIFQFKANSQIVQTIILESAVGESKLKLKDESNEHFLSGGLTLRLRTPAISIFKCQILSFFNVNLCFKFTDFYCENWISPECEHTICIHNMRQTSCEHTYPYISFLFFFFDFERIARTISFALRHIFFFILNLLFRLK